MIPTIPIQTKSGRTLGSVDAQLGMVLLGRFEIVEIRGRRLVLRDSTGETFAPGDYWDDPDFVPPMYPSDAPERFRPVASIARALGMPMPTPKTRMGLAAKADILRVAGEGAE